MGGRGYDGTGGMGSSGSSHLERGDRFMGGRHQMDQRRTGRGGRRGHCLGYGFLTQVTARLNSLEMKGGTLFFSNNWDACVIASDIWIREGSTVRHQANYAAATNAFGEWPVNSRIYIICTNFFLGGTVNADVSGWVSRGFELPAAGPGGGRANRAGAGHGGYGGNASDGGGEEYGQIEEPVLPGSAGAPDGTTPGGAGGGAVRIESHGGTVTINGTVSANGNTSGNIRGGGSGGSIWISCRVFAATGGIIRAIGGWRAGAYCLYCGSGGGGRIAVIGPKRSDFNGALSVQPGRAKEGYEGEEGTIYWEEKPIGRGTVMFIR